MEPLSSTFTTPPPSSFDFSLSNPNPNPSSLHYHPFPAPPSASLLPPRTPLRPTTTSSSSSPSPSPSLPDPPPSSWPLPHYWESAEPLHCLRPSSEQASLPHQHRPGVTIASLEDGSIGLKLGKRTYYGEPASGGDETLSKKPGGNAGETAAAVGSASSVAPKIPPTSPSSASVAAVASTKNVVKNNNSSSSSSACSTTVTSAAVAKKQKSSSAAVLPRCQVEGCKADLSASKDYHRRHKVCEAHSKASKVRVAGLEQRFCQQCSRFHVLTEFDEGKRSCRRRLAGHNERRRKPQQEPISLLSPRFALFPDGRMNSLLEHPCFLQHRRVLAQQEAIANYQMLDLHPYSHCFSSGGGRSNAIIDAGRALMVYSNDHHHHHHHSLALSNTSAPNSAIAPSAGAASSPSISIVSDHQPSSEMAISGRALSLLSSPPIVSQINPSPSSSTTPLLEATSPSPYQIYSAGIHAFSSSCPQVSSCLSMDMEDCKSLAMSNSSAMFSMFPDNGFLNLHSGGSSQPPPARPVLDLMQVSSTESHLHSQQQQQQQQQQQADMPYTDLQGLSIFGRKTIL